ncbi:undecaprenyl-diphosphate phosphatase [Candidatus Roizmanbacteria bacterium]|nr:undecaprenyl-diphosphate phosphatase [Candidatus Roizmanbacteria bacterium]
MELIQAVILGVVEGLTEFLPISSTFHLIFASKILGIPETNFLKLFEVFIQSGAILAVVFLYYKDFVSNRALLKNIAFSFLPTMIIGFVLYSVIKKVFFEAYGAMVLVFLLVGALFLGVEWLVKKNKIQLKNPLGKLTVKQAVIIGLFQSLAVMPGVSRSGAVIIGMMFLGFKREDSAKYSFLISVPTIIAASLYDLFKMRNELTTNNTNVVLLFIGFFTSFVSAYFVIKWFIGFLKNNTLNVFGAYRILVSVLLFLSGLVK